MSDYIRWERDRVHHQYADMLARIRSGVRVTYRMSRWYVLSNPHGLGEVCWGAYTNPREAAVQYMLCCSLADLKPSEHIYVAGHVGA